MQVYRTSNRLLLLIILLLAPPIHASVDGLPVTSTDDIRFVVDAVSRQGTGGETSEHLAILIPNRQIKFVRTSEAILAAELDIVIYFRRWPTGELLARKQIGASLEVKSKKLARGAHDLQILESSFLIPPGPYELEVKVSDRNTLGFGFFHLFGRNARSGTALGRFVAKEFRGEGLAISDIHFGRDVDTTSQSVLANPNRLFGATMPELAYSYEVYLGLTPEEKSAVPYDVRREVFDEDGQIWAVEDERLTYSGEGTRFRRAGVQDLSAIPGGSYRYRVTVRRSDGSDSTATESPFHVVWSKEDLALINGNESSGADFFSELGIEVEVKSLSYILTQDDIQMVELLSPEEQREWITTYWEDRDPTPGTPLNELRMEHYRRIYHANQRFGSIRNIGMDTDRGRIYIRYGEPEQISSGFSAQSFFQPLGGFNIHSDQARVGGIRGGTNVEEKAYEIWVFGERGRFLGERRNKAAGLQLRFVFVDVEGYGEYTLTESTDRSEF